MDASTKNEGNEPACPGLNPKCINGLITYECRPEPYDDPQNRFAKYKPVFCSDCQKGKQLKSEWEIKKDKCRREYLLKRSNLPSSGIFENVTLDSFALTTNGTTDWFEEVKRWVENWNPAGSRGLILYGRCGVGKTGLLTTALKELINRLFVCVFYITVADFCNHIGEAWVERTGEDYILINKMRETNVLFLDEVGAGHSKVSEIGGNSPLDNLFKVIDYRYRQGKPILLATNCETPLELMGILGERNFNRVYETCKELLCEGKNLRQKN